MKEDHRGLKTLQKNSKAGRNQDDDDRPRFNEVQGRRLQGGQSTKVARLEAADNSGRQYSSEETRTATAISEGGGAAAASVAIASFLCPKTG